MTITVADLAAFLNADVAGAADTLLSGIAPIETAAPGEVTFLSNKRYLRYIDDTRASAIIVDASTPVERADLAVLRVGDAYLAFVRVLRLFHPRQPAMAPGVHPTAVVPASAALGAEVAIGPHVTIGEGVTIGDRSSIGAGTVLGDGVSIGADCIIHPNVTIIAAASVGCRVIINAGAIIGGDGFGFAPVEGVYEKIPQVGTVIIEDDVEIGANTTVDRATLGATRIRRGVKLDNLIQVAHNVEIGEDTVIASQSGISGSTTVGSHVLIAGQVGIVGHISIGDGVTVGAQSGVSKSIAGPGTVFRGAPAQEIQHELRLQAAQRRIPQLLATVEQLEERLRKLEEHSDS